MIDSSVDLPAPFGPRIATVSPSATPRDTSKPRASTRASTRRITGVSPARARRASTAA
jgi:hypothetical protein